MLGRGKESGLCVYKKRLLKGSKREMIRFVYFKKPKDDGRDETAISSTGELQLHCSFYICIEMCSRERINSVTFIFLGEKRSEMMDILKMAYSLNKTGKFSKCSSVLQR